MHNILIAEDDGPTRTVISELLQRAGFSVTDVIDGVEALEQLRKGFSI